ncbi:WecB/TagA/CpsF family glycosyltransferase [Rhodoferax sp.]|uniref:WecB/TagA/CpsF family glycosyltransferase n=1 Tax=Rhodoferax sp. TaxID=50421 RepID=UPI00262011CD|nr:WecB/TagA/CpsF family glycosyltransferase [Rhodoferax sp.]MDD3934900.1 WecB/TagA/CpsF family glycosyltransferase [Rhodoferax sp.]
MSIINLTQFNGITIFDESIENLISIIRDRDSHLVSYIVTPNADHFYRLSDGRNIDFIDSYANADFIICDSRIIQKLSIFENKTISNVIPGSDLTKKIIASAWAKDIKILIIGPAPEDVEIIKQKFNLPHLKSYAPPMGFINDEREILKCIKITFQSEFDIVFIAVGSPQQEILANRLKKSTANTYKTGPILLCVGASFDFLSGKITRAPLFIQKLNLEWLHRALSDPLRLLPRYWNNFIWIVFYIKKRF